MQRVNRLVYTGGRTLFTVKPTFYHKQFTNSFNKVITSSRRTFHHNVRFFDRQQLELQLESQLQTENYSRALETVYELIHEDPNNYEWYMDLSTIFQQLNRYQDSIDAMKKSFEIAPEISDQITDATRYGILGENYLKMERFAEALANLSKSIDLLGTEANYHIYLLRAGVYQILKRTKEAHDDMMHAMTIQPEKEDPERDYAWHLHMYSQLFTLLQQKFEKETAQKTIYHIDEVMAIDKERTLSLYLSRASINMKLKKFDQAKKDLDSLNRQLSTKNPDYQRLMLLRQVMTTELYIAKNQLSQAQSTIEELIRDHSQSLEGIKELDKCKELRSYIQERIKTAGSA